MRTNAFRKSRSELRAPPCSSGDRTKAMMGAKTAAWPAEPREGGVTSGRRESRLTDRIVVSRDRVS